MAYEDFDKVKVESLSMMLVEKFVDPESIDPIYYDASYYLAPDGKGAEDVYAVLREAIRKTGKVALTRVVISQRERTVAVRPMDGGLAAHTLNEERDLNSAKPFFEDVRDVRVDPEMVKLAVQLVDRQTGRYDPADLEDRYETRLRAMIEAKIQGVADQTEGAPPRYHDTNIIDLMAALKKSIGEPIPRGLASEGAPVPAKSPAKRAKKPVTPEEIRRQPGFKLPIEGGQKKERVAEAAVEQEAPGRVARGRRNA